MFAHAFSVAIAVPVVADLESRVQGEERELHLALTGTYSGLLVIVFGIDLLAW